METPKLGREETALRVIGFDASAVGWRLEDDGLLEIWRSLDETEDRA
jgi:hypothetical protein